MNFCSDWERLPDVATVKTLNRFIRKWRGLDKDWITVNSETIELVYALIQKVYERVKIDLSDEKMDELDLRNRYDNLYKPRFR